MRNNVILLRRWTGLCTLSLLLLLSASCASVENALLKTNEVFKEGNSPLHNAALDGKTEEVARLIADKKTNINKKNTAGITPLSLAAGFNQTEVVKLLLNDPRIKINETDTQGNNPLINASLRGNTEVARLLLGHKANLSHANKEGQFPLLLAAFNGRTEVFKLLLDSGADINKHSKDSVTPLMIAVLEKQTDIMKMILAMPCADLDLRNSLGNTALNIAAKSGNLEAVKLLVAAGADPSLRDNLGYTPYKIAASSAATEKPGRKVEGTVVYSSKPAYGEIASFLEGRNKPMFKRPKQVCVAVKGVGGSASAVTQEVVAETPQSSPAVTSEGKEPAAAETPKKITAEPAKKKKNAKKTK